MNTLLVMLVLTCILVLMFGLDTVKGISCCRSLNPKLVQLEACYSPFVAWGGSRHEYHTSWLGALRGRPSTAEKYNRGPEQSRKFEACRPNPFKPISATVSMEISAVLITIPVNSRNCSNRYVLEKHDPQASLPSQPLREFLRGCKCNFLTSA